MLAASNLRFARGGVRILRDLSLAVSPGELVAIIGPNGAGKSTLLQMLSGALPPDEGTVSLDGAPLDRWSRDAVARRRAVLPQASALGFPFRVLDVVLLGRSPHAGRTSRRDDLAAAEAAMREADVLDLADRVYTTLSGGERQRVQLARILAQIWPGREGPADHEGGRYLLLDEPTNNLDLAHQHAIMATARRLAQRGLGVAAILHDPNLAAWYAGRVCVLRDGQLVASGPPQEVFTESLLEAVFAMRVKVLLHSEHDRPYMLPA